MHVKEVWATVKETASDWSDDNASRLAAALALMSLVLSTVLSALGTAFTGALPGGEGIWQAVTSLFTFSAIILFMGAEFTQVQARRQGPGIRPSKNAMPADTESEHAVEQAPTA